MFVLIFYCDLIQVDFRQWRCQCVVNARAVSVRDGVFEFGGKFNDPDDHHKYRHFLPQTRASIRRTNTVYTRAQPHTPQRTRTEDCVEHKQKAVSFATTPSQPHVTLNHVVKESGGAVNEASFPGKRAFSSSPPDEWVGGRFCQHFRFAGALAEGGSRGVRGVLF